MNRRDVIGMLGASAAWPLLQPSLGCAATSTAYETDWRPLQDKLGERLMKLHSPLQACADADGKNADALFAKFKNPYYLGDEPALTQTLGWTDAWASRASDYAVAAESAADVAAAVDFARNNRLRLVVKGGGHSYFGNSNAAGSLLIWTRRMQTVTLHDDFVGQGCSVNTSPVPAASIGAGAIWGHAYDSVTTRGGRYIQGGGCLTVGVAGFIQGGGFGSLSKQFGTGAANLLEAEVVTADGAVRIANAVHESELFYALKGGGGGTFGVVTRLTLRTHDLPATIGAVIFAVQAQSDASWRALVARIVEFYAGALFNPVWGEQLRFSPDRTLSVSMLFHGLQKAQAEAVWQPFFAWLADQPKDYKLAGEPAVLAAPAQRFWDPSFLKQLPGIVLSDDRPGAPIDNIFWASNLSEAGQVLHAYQSAWLPATLLDPTRQTTLVEALVAGSAEWSMSLHTNKGLAGGSAEALTMARDTATNPDMLGAFALLICAAAGAPSWPGIPGHEPDFTKGRRDAARVAQAMQPIRRMLPAAGSYMSEADYFDTDWQGRYWGENYARLLKAKQHYDPTGLFQGRHLVGST